MIKGWRDKRRRKTKKNCSASWREAAPLRLKARARVRKQEAGLIGWLRVRVEEMILQLGKAVRKINLFFQLCPKPPEED